MFVGSRENSLRFEGIEVSCDSCDGSGLVPEDHQPGLVEMLSCRDCLGKGVVDRKYWLNWIITLEAAGFSILWGDPRR